MSIIDKRVAIGRVNKDSTGQSHEIRFDRRVDGRGGVHVHSRKDIPVLIRDDDRPIFFDRDDAGFLDQGSIAARNEHRGAGDGKTTSASFALIHATDSSLE